MTRGSGWGQSRQVETAPSRRQLLPVPWSAGSGVPAAVGLCALGEWGGHHSTGPRVSCGSARGSGSRSVHADRTCAAATRLERGLCVRASVCAHMSVRAHVCARTCAQVWAWRAGPLRALLPDACRRGPAVARELVPGVTTVSGVPVSGDQAGSSAEVTGCSGAGIGQAPQRSYPHTRCTHACLTHSHSYQSTRAYTPILTYTHPYTLTPVHTHTCTHAHRLLVHTCTPTHTHVHARSLAHVHTHTGSSGSQDPSWGAPVPWAGSVDTGQNRRHPGPHRPHTKLPLTRSHTSSGRDSHLAGWVAEAGRGSARTPSALGTPRGPALCSWGTRRVIVPTPSEVRTGVTSTSPTKTPRAGEAQWLTPSHAASWGACAPPPGAAAALVWRSEGARWPRGGSGGGAGGAPARTRSPFGFPLPSSSQNLFL